MSNATAARRRGYNYFKAKKVESHSCAPTALLPEFAH